MALSVGGMVYFIMTGRYGQDFDAAVQTSVDEQLAALQSAPQGAPPAKVRVAPVRLASEQDRIAMVGRLHEVRRVVVSTQGRRPGRRSDGGSGRRGGGGADGAGPGG